MTMVVEGWILASDVGKPMGRLGITIYPEPRDGQKCYEVRVIVQANPDRARAEFGPDIGADGEAFLAFAKSEQPHD